MAFAYQGEGALDYFPCRYGTSKLLFRGPRRSLEGAFCAVLGGTESYGKFVPQPFPDLVEAATGLRMVNLACMNAGIDVYLNDPSVAGIAAKAQIAVVQVVGAANLTNRLYSVHPRRNDRFLSASPVLRAMYREVDFADFTFTRHMIQTLYAVSPDKFTQVAAELRAAWVARMRTLLGRIPSQTLLLWIADHAPAREGPLTPDASPLLVDAEMIAAVRPHASQYLEVVISEEARRKGTEGMTFPPLDAPIAAEVPGPAVHAEIAAALGPALLRLM
ncbi:DUF6473 family protein [Cereibacter sphaeroides]|uniref:DUF6473 family protein n=1 Tax=Cereibacter sphaeroides TaxID=1063 RepID=UPI001F38E357|nr:DUF6473 family protein [Cereibacter sphaeroides]MCE6958409.1 DUF6473 family protein [Cereibacter sphaeroides]MCE6967801.1 DUF6473 family protein [Cereibacter sphaeroides]MCE6972614.1 DUF6473 family protein [Cereibacter sphaeroides]